MGTITHAAERKAFEVALNAVVRKTEKGGETDMWEL